MKVKKEINGFIVEDELAEEDTPQAWFKLQWQAEQYVLFHDLKGNPKYRQFADASDLDWSQLAACLGQVFKDFVLIPKDKFQPSTEAPSPQVAEHINQLLTGLRNRDTELQGCKDQLRDTQLRADGLQELLNDANKQLRITNERLEISHSACNNLSQQLEDKTKQLENLQEEVQTAWSRKYQGDRITFTNISKDLNDIMQELHRTINRIEQINSVAYKKGKS